MAKWGARSARRLAWVAFLAQVTAVFIWAALVDRSDPPKTLSGESVGAEKSRFGLPETTRRQMYQALLRGEPADRAAALRDSETAIWNRNHDSYFHQLEWRRLRSVCAQLSIPFWVGYLILDEGMRNHWEVPPGVTIYPDDTPLVRLTRPLAQRRPIAVGVRD